MLESAVAHVSSMQDEEEVEESTVLPALEPSSPSLIPVEDDDGKDMKKIDLSTSSPASSPSPPSRESIESNNTPRIQKQISNESVDHGNLFGDLFEEEEAKE
tara:strand:- start:95 stop:400 length:306 start_codon:yes stop_codon:yes gene_type:complete